MIQIKPKVGDLIRICDPTLQQAEICVCIREHPRYFTVQYLREPPHAIFRYSYWVCQNYDLEMSIISTG